MTPIKAFRCFSVLLHFFSIGFIQADVVLNHIDILSLRLAAKYFGGRVFRELISKEGQDILFTDISKDIGVLVVDNYGKWRWRTHETVELIAEKNGSDSDAIVLFNLLSDSIESNDDYGISNRIMTLCKDNARLWIIDQGGSIQGKSSSMRSVVNQTLKIWNDESVSPSIRNSVGSLTGRLLLSMKDEEREILLEYFDSEQKEEFNNWMESSINVDQDLNLNSLMKEPIADDVLDDLAKHMAENNLVSIDYNSFINTDRMEDNQYFEIPIGAEKSLIIDGTELIENYLSKGKELEDFIMQASKSDFFIYDRFKNTIGEIRSSDLRDKIEALTEDEE